MKTGATTMHRNARILTVLILAAATGIDANAQGAAQPARAPKIDLDILYLGAAPDAGGAASARATRARAFADFLRGEFSSVRVAARDGFDPKSVGDADVVLLDWSQLEVDIMKMREIRSPLGPRDAWQHPTVLLGSAGLLLAGPWQLKGAHG